MRLLPRLAVLATLSLAAALPAQAYTPESGIWWNPNEPGSGYTMEIQDNLLVLSYYGGNGSNGQPLWYTAVGFLTGNALFANKPLDLTLNSQCAGCAYTGRPTVQPGAGGTVTVTFDPNDNTRATLTWGNGRSVPIERYAFYLKRPEDGNTPLQVTRMLGEWQAVSDFSDSSAADFPYYGDVLVFDLYDFDNPTNRWYYDGCRADNSQDGGCSNDALAFHSASGYFDASTGLHVTVVDDSNSTWALYLSETGTNAALGEVTVYAKGDDPDDYAAYPTRLFRTASRTFVEEGVGPSKARGPASLRPGLGDLITPQRLDSAKRAGASRFDRAALSPIIRELETKLTAKRAKALAHSGQ